MRASKGTPIRLSKSQQRSTVVAQAQAVAFESWTWTHGQPRVAHQRPSGAPLIAGLATFVGLFILKAVILSQIGSAAYRAQVDLLAHGTWVEQAAGLLLRLDPVTETLSHLLSNPI